MNFNNILTETYPGFSYTPYSFQRDAEWVEGEISISFLNSNFGEYKNATEMKNATTSEGLKLYFDWLAEQGKIPN